ncbi:glycosyltransferase [Capnocytophaga cynodegmi]|uniref:glycosyltransferase n=1 Tax=Capnocytophaga cynodegmi TaxID=28189 RepID=UPI00385BADD1
MKVLTIINSANMGGIEKTLLSCLNHMKEEELSMSILCYEPLGVLEKKFRKLGVDFLYIKKTGMIVLDALQILLILLRHKFDLVHSRFGFTSGGFVLGSKLVGKKIYVSLHSTEPSSLKKFRSNKILFRMLFFHLKIHKYITMRFADKIIGHSKSNLYSNYPEWKTNEKFQLIYNGIDFDTLDNDLEESEKLNIFKKVDDFVILHIGNFRPVKNHSLLIEGFHDLNPKCNNYKLILVGDGESLTTVKKRVKELDMSDHVFFAGFDENIGKYLEKADLFVLPSLTEGLGNVLIEAQYKGVPICVSNIPPLYESGYREYHKYYFDPSDKKMMVEKLNQIISDIKQNKLNNTINEARKYVIKNFSIKSMTLRLLNLYYEK